MAEISRLPTPVTENWDWQADGACRGLDSKLFFHPENERGPRRAAREELAKAVCQRCPVRQRCREHAIAVHETYGIWGGLGESELRSIYSGAAHSE